MTNSESAKEKGNGKAGEEITQVMQRKEKEKKVCKFNFSFTVNYFFYFCEEKMTAV